MKHGVNVYVFVLLCAFAIRIHLSYAQELKMLEESVNDFSSDPVLKGASWGLNVIKADNPVIAFEHNADVMLVPASTQKLVTTITGFFVLGKDYRFQTHLLYDGIISNGVLNGNLYIKGYGDPVLGASQMNDSLSIDNLFLFFFKQMQEKGISEVRGNLIADATFFDKHMIPRKWFWEDIGNYYGAGSHALTLHENTYSVYFQPGKTTGEKAEVSGVYPQVPQLAFVNHVTTGQRNSGDNVYIFGAPGQHKRWLTGTVPKGEPGFEVKGSVPDPAMMIGYLFKQYLQKNKVDLSGEVIFEHDEVSEYHGKKKSMIAVWKSPYYKTIAARTNQKSMNGYAENIFKTMGKIKTGEGSFEKAAEFVTDFWESSGMDTQGLRIHDGSGLSPFNGITVSQLSQMILHAYHKDEIWNELLDGLPVAGRSGSLKSMLRGTQSEGVLQAKSGFLSNVRSYAGHTVDQSGDVIIFAFIVNNYDDSPISMRRKMEKVLEAITLSDF